MKRVVPQTEAVEFPQHLADAGIHVFDHGDVGFAVALLPRFVFRSNVLVAIAGPESSIAPVAVKSPAYQNKLALIVNSFVVLSFLAAAAGLDALTLPAITATSAATPMINVSLFALLAIALPSCWRGSPTYMPRLGAMRRVAALGVSVSRRRHPRGPG